MISPLPAMADTPVYIEVDVAGLKQFVLENKSDFLRLGKGVLSNFQIEMPKNLFDVTQQAIQGDVLLNVNGIPVDVSVLSDTGGVDVAVISDKGDISLTIASQYLPKLPLLEKPDIPINPEALADFRAARLEIARNGPPSFWEETSVLDLFRQGWTNGQVIGSTLFATGYAVLASKSVYDYEIQKAEREMERQQEVMEEKKRLAAAAREKLENEVRAKNEARQKRKAKLEAERTTAEAEAKILDVASYIEFLEYSPTVVPQEPAVVPQFGVFTSPRFEETSIPRRRKKLYEKVSKERVEQAEAQKRKLLTDIALQQSASSIPGITADTYIEALEYSPTVVPQKATLLEQTGCLSSPKTIRATRKRPKRKLFQLFQR